MQSIIDGLILFLNILIAYVRTIFRAIVPASLVEKKSLKGKKVLITGSGSGVGRGLAIEFGKHGSEVILWDVNESGNSETLKLLQDDGVQARAYKVDLSSNEEINRTAELVRTEVGKIDILINNAGIASGKLLLDLSDEMIERSFAVNVKSHFYTVKNFLPKMLEENDGHIVTIASLAGKVAGIGMEDYFASKHAAVGFHDSLAVEIAVSGKTGVKTTLVCPYYINTPLFDTSGTSTRFPRLFPFLEVDYTAKKIVEAVQLNQEYLLMPKSFYPYLAIRGLLPVQAQRLVSRYLRTGLSIDRFNRPRDPE